MAITQEKLKLLFDYDEQSGLFIRKVANTGNVRIGEVVGYLGNNGYLSVGIKGKRFYLHRLAWLYVFGKFPNNEIDHINHCRTDNRICNLREVRRIEQTQNASRRNDNTSGAVGVSWQKDIKRWRARINVDGKDVALGCFGTFYEAVNARKNAEILYGFHKNHGKEKEGGDVLSQ